MRPVCGCCNGCAGLTMPCPSLPCRLRDRPLAPAGTASCRVLHAAFHPLSDHHVVVLSSDYRLRMFDLRDVRDDHSLTAQEPEVEVALPHSALAGQPRTFCFGARRGFEQFAVFIATTRGSVYVACPFVPGGCSMPASEWRALRAEVQADLDAAAGVGGAASGSSASQVKGRRAQVLAAPRARRSRRSRVATAVTHRVAPKRRV